MCFDVPGAVGLWAPEGAVAGSASGPSRLEAPGKAGIPHLIVPGCIDMANYGPRDTVPDKYNDRLLYEWNPSVTLMRTDKEENRQMGEIFASEETSWMVERDSDTSAD